MSNQASEIAKRLTAQENSSAAIYLDEFYEWDKSGRGYVRKEDRLLVSFYEVMAEFAASEVSRTTKELQVAIGKERDQLAALQEKVKALSGTLLKLANEASGFRCMADINRHGATNMRVLGDRITAAFDLLSALSQVSAQKEQGQ